MANVEGMSTMGKFEPVFNLQVQQIGCMQLEDVGTDALLFLSDAAMENRAPGNNNDGGGTSLVGGTRK